MSPDVLKLFSPSLPLSLTSLLPTAGLGKDISRPIDLLHPRRLFSVLRAEVWGVAEHRTWNTLFLLLIYSPIHSSGITNPPPLKNLKPPVAGICQDIRTPPRRAVLEDAARHRRVQVDYEKQLFGIFGDGAEDEGGRAMTTITMAAEDGRRCGWAGMMGLRMMPLAFFPFFLHPVGSVPITTTDIQADIRT